MQPIAIVRNRNHHTPLLCFGVLLILGAVLWPTLSPAQGSPVSSGGIQPVSIAAHAVIGEKQARTLEPLLATPVSTGELLVAKMLGALLPTLVISLAGLGLYLGGIVATAAPGVASAMLSLRTAMLAVQEAAERDRPAGHHPLPPPAEATNLYADLMAQYLSEADVDALLEFYKSSAGQRATEAAKKVGPQWQETIGKKAQESIMGHYKEFEAEMVKIAAECEAAQTARQKQSKRRGGKH